VAYEDYVNSNKATVMKYNGSNWITVGSAGFSADRAIYTSLAIDGTCTPYVAYADAGNGYQATVMRCKGGSWVTVGSAGFSTNNPNSISLAIDGIGTPYVANSCSYYGGDSWKARVQKPDLEVLVSLYPNPMTKGSFVVSAPEAGSLGVYDLEGREVMRSEVKVGTTDVTLPSNTLTGVYICRFTSKNGGAVTARLTYEHE
jgi:hypothetical protein